MPYTAIAEDGPLGGNVNLTVDKEPDGTWPTTQEWTTGPNEKHTYRFLTVAVGGLGGQPVYRHVPPDDA